MAPVQFIKLLAISSLAVLACSFGATPVTALATDRHFIRDTLAHGHGTIVKRKRAASNKPCKPRPSSSAQPKPTHKPVSDKGNGGNKSEPTSTKHSSSSYKPSSTPSSGGGGKVGLAWANGGSVELKPFVTKNVKYIYTWSPNNVAGASALGLTNMPMLWGDNFVGDFKKLVKKGYATAAMGPNEPNESGQSNMSPSHGASLWKEYLEPLYHQGYTVLCSPATSSNPNGMVWMKNFFDACNGGCNPTHMCLHYYDTTAKGLITYMELWHNTFNKPVMLTEAACENFNGGSQCSQSEVESFVTDSVNFMESTDWVHAYFFFGFMKQMQGVNTLNQLMNGGGKPNALGEKILNP